MSEGERPAPNLVPPPADGDLEVLRELLAIERARLQVARRIEEERKIVFPETSVIVRDIERLLDAIARREGRHVGPATPAPPPEPKKGKGKRAKERAVGRRRGEMPMFAGWE